MARKTLEGRLRRENYESQRAAKRENPAFVFLFVHKGVNHRVVLPIGSDDNHRMLVEDDRVYCVSWNCSLDYCGVTVWDVEPHSERTLDESGSAFWQSSEQIEEVLGKRGLDLATNTIIRRLCNHVDERCY
jgi:hypothetical protein